MLLTRLRTRSRSILLPFACLGQLLAHSEVFLTLSSKMKGACHLAGLLLFLFVLWNAVQWFLSTKVERKRTTSDAWADGATVITGTALLLFNRFAHMTHMLHGLCDIAGWTLVVFCWFSPTSRWQAVSFAGLYLIALSDVRWRAFSAFGGLNIYGSVALLVLWAAVSALAYLFLSRRKPTPISAGLN